MSGQISPQGLQGYQSYQRRLARGAFTAAVTVGLVIYLLGFAPVAKGLVLGALFSVFNFVIMAYVLPHQVGAFKTQKRATGLAFVSFAFRLALLAIPLAVSLKSDQFRFWAVVVGLFTVQFAIMAEHLIIRRWMGVRSTQEPSA